jgi:ferredoxin
MIVGECKPREEIAASLAGCKRVLLLACRGCVAVCRAGGDNDGRTLAAELSHPRYFHGRAPEFTIDGVERQCEFDLLKTWQPPAGVDAVLSLACGAGVQLLAERLGDLPVIPALNTTFLGAAEEAGLWREKCRGCGDCLLERTAGICPISRCSKSLLNGPCGGTKDGHCEVDQNIPCAWLLIYEKLSRQKKLDRITEFLPVRDWRPAGGAGPRQRVRRGLEAEKNLP